MSSGTTTSESARPKPPVLRIGICVALVALGVVLAVVLHLPGHLVLDTGPGAYAVGPITPHARLVQELEVTGPLRITSVGVLLATWGRPTNTTHDRITVYDGSGREIQSLDLPPGTVKDNAYAEVHLGTALSIEDRGKLFVVLSSADGSKTDSITAWATKASVEGGLYSVPAGATASGSPVADRATAKRLPDALCVQAVGLGPRGLLAEKVLKAGALLVCLALAALVWWADGLRRWWRAKRPTASSDGEDQRLSWRSRLNVEKTYLVVALAWGVILVFLTPPLQTFDELAHYYRAWSVAEGQIVVPASGRVDLPSGAEALTGLFPTGPMAFRLQKMSLDGLQAGLGQSLGSTSVPSSSAAASYGPIGYLPQAIGVDLIWLVRGPPLAALYLGRLLNLLAAVLLTYFGLRLLPFAKLAVGLVALLPMTMMEMASLSPDALLIGGSIFFVGLVVRCTTKERVSGRDIALLVLSAVLLLNAKPGYALLSLLLLLLLPRQFSSRLAYAATVGGSIVASGLLTLVFMKLAPNAGEFLAVFLGADNRVDGPAQLRYVIAHPLDFARAVGNTVSSQGVFLLRQTVAAYAWGQRNIGDLVVLVAAMGVAAVLTVAETVNFAAWRRVLMLGVGLLTAVVVALGLYMGWTAVGAQEIAGLQGRYFVPCFILGFIGLAGFPFGKRWAVPVVIGAVVLVLIAVNLYTLLTYYY